MMFASALRSGFTDGQAERFNRAMSLQNSASAVAFVESLSPVQRDQLKRLSERTTTLESQRTQLLQDINGLQRDTAQIQHLEARVAERRAFSDRLFRVGVALTQAGQYQQQQLQQQQAQQQFLFQQMQTNQQLDFMNQQLQTIQQQQRANCVRRAMQSRVPMFCP